MYYGCNRYLCEVLEEMRTMLKLSKDVVPLNVYNMILSLIEEVQIMGNRMEASISDLKDLENLHNDIKREKKNLLKLQEKIKELKKEKNGNNTNTNED